MYTRRCFVKNFLVKLLNKMAWKISKKKKIIFSKVAGAKNEFIHTFFFKISAKSLGTLECLINFLIFFHPGHSYSNSTLINHLGKFPTQKNFLKQIIYADFFCDLAKRMASCENVFLDLILQDEIGVFCCSFELFIADLLFL